MDCSIPGLPVHYQLPELTQTHVHRVGDAIQPSHPLSSPSPAAFNLFPSIRIFSNESVLRIRWPKCCSFTFSISPSNEHSGLSATRVVSSAYLRLLVFLLAILIPACDSSSLAFHMMYSAYKLNKQGDNIQPSQTPFLIWKQPVVSCPVLTMAS